jgi:hypothetical protein
MGEMSRARRVRMKLAASHPFFRFGLVALLGACDARINQFAPTAHYVCAGQEVTLRWNVTGSANMKATPKTPGISEGPIDDDGQATFTPVTTTSIELHVTRFLGHATSSVQEVHVTDAPTMAEPLVASLADPGAGCADGKVWATIHAKNFSPDIKVAAIARRNGDDRTYQITHGGVQGDLGPENDTKAFQGTPIFGDWIILSPLRAGEACHTASLPRSFGIDVFMQCHVKATP